MLEAAMIGVFISLDLFLFYVFWDAMLIPMYFLIGIWGYDQRIYASIKFMLYTMAGSVLMLLAIIWLAYYHQTRHRRAELRPRRPDRARRARQAQTWLFLAFAVAFAIKVPLFPFHTWLPDAHVQAPTAGSVILAGVLLKMGTYGLLRFAFPLVPRGGVAVCALDRHPRGDRHRLRRARRDGAAGHEEAGGLLVGEPPRRRRARPVRAQRAGACRARCTRCSRTASRPADSSSSSACSRTGVTRKLIAEYGGLKAVMPKLVAAFLLVTLASVALPGMNGFIGEFLILLGTFNRRPCRTRACSRPSRPPA